MTNRLVGIINSLKVQKIKKILLYEMKFLVPNYSCLQNPWLEGATAPRSPFSLSSVLNWIFWTPPPKKNSWLRHWLGPRQTPARWVVGFIPGGKAAGGVKLTTSFEFRCWRNDRSYFSAPPVCLYGVRRDKCTVSSYIDWGRLRRGCWRRLWV